ncbi:MAG: DNA alkylation repair protein [Clostridia bacterium]|nr:DNA alkylation repair protein [Clostridia bacterium]
MTDHPVSDQIYTDLLALQEIPYRDFQKKLIPTVEPDRILGIRTPLLRRYARELAGHREAELFLAELPHAWFEQNQLHAFLLSGMKDYSACLAGVSRFLPYIDNWATCDQLSPRVFRKHRAELLPVIREWLRNSHPYTVRFGIGMLMEHFLDEDFDPSCPEMVAGIHSSEYYVNMMIAWYFATALAKQYDAALPYLQLNRLDPWTHNKTIQKSLESFRIPPERKAELKMLRIPNKP